MAKQNIELFIHGRVQGVYYRKTIQSYAEKNKINGYIENLHNGSVHCIAELETSKIEAFIEFCKKGSFFSQVQSIEKQNLSDTKKMNQGFFIRKEKSFLFDQKSSFSHLIKNMLGIKKKNKIRVIPEHIVIIPNGNRTWAKKRGLKAWAGYWETYKNLNSIMKEAEVLGVSHMTLWGFSTENWKRNKDEVEELFKVISMIIENLKQTLVKEKIQFNHLGRKDRLPKDLLRAMNELEEKTKEFKGRSLNIALDYGGRDEIIRAVNELLQSGKKSITEEEFSNVLDTKNIPDPDLIIRTANEKRLSGMMPWQATYAEYYFADIYFPDFKGKDLRKAIIDFNTRKRTFGGDVDKNKKTN